MELTPEQQEIVDGIERELTDWVDRYIVGAHPITVEQYVGLAELYAPGSELRAVWCDVEEYRRTGELREYLTTVMPPEAGEIRFSVST